VTPAPKRPKGVQSAAAAYKCANVRAEGGDSNPLDTAAPSQDGTRGNPCRTRAFLLRVMLEGKARKQPFAAPSGRETCTEGAQPIGRVQHRDLGHRRTSPTRPRAATATRRTRCSPSPRPPPRAVAGVLGGRRAPSFSEPIALRIRRGVPVSALPATPAYGSHVRNPERRTRRPPDPPSQSEQGYGRWLAARGVR